MCAFMFLFIISKADAQYIHKIKADSVKITNNTLNAELIIENSTRDTLGFLYNKGNGRTEFRKLLKKINDSSYLVGPDTLFTRPDIGYTSVNLQTVTNNGNTTTHSIITSQDSYFAGVRVGIGAGNGGRNTILGNEALMSNTYSKNDGNVAIGYKSMRNVNDSNSRQNTAVGVATLIDNTSGRNNVAVGYETMKMNSTGYNNTAMGYQALYGDSSQQINYQQGLSNVAIGYKAMHQSYKGSGNVAVGTEALSDSLNRSYNVAIGHFAAKEAKADSSVYIGLEAGMYNTSSNSLMIDNSSTSTPLIHGNFRADSIRINGTLSIRDVDSVSSPMNMLFVTKEGRIKKAAPPSGGGGGSGTVTSISGGFGLTGGTITTSGTLAVDSSLIATKFWRQKGIDSLGTVKQPRDTVALPFNDEDYTVSVSHIGMSIIPDLTYSSSNSNHNVIMPVAPSGKVMYFHNQNTHPTYKWIFTGVEVQDAAGNTITTLQDQKTYTLCFGIGKWRVISVN